MIRIQRLAPGAAVLLAFSLSGCGDGAPTDASATDFCATATDRDWVEGLGTEPNSEAIVDALEKWGGDLDEVGTPEDIPDDARDGFDITVDYLSDLDPDDFENLEDVDPTSDLSDEEQEKVEEFNTYVAETCVPDSEIDVPEPSIS